MRNSPWQRANALYLEINGKSCWFFARIIYNRLFMHNHKYLYTICICICVLFSKRIALWLFLLSCVNLASRNVYKIVRIISIRSWDRVGVAFSKERVCEWMHCLDEWIPNLLGNTTIWAWMKSKDGDCLPAKRMQKKRQISWLFTIQIDIHISQMNDGANKQIIKLIYSY